MRDYANEVPENPIFTMGYEGTDISAYLDKLISAKIDVLVDVRDRPQSRKRGFSKNGLRAAVEGAGIDYVHMQSLGDPKPGREAARAGEWDLFREIFDRHMSTVEARKAIETLAVEFAGRRVCLMCFEKDHTCCHRSIVAEDLSRQTGAAIVHLSI